MIYVLTTLPQHRTYFLSPDFCSSLQIYRPGKDASYSSEEEEEAKKDQAEREDTLGQALDLDGEPWLNSLYAASNLLCVLYF